METTTSHEWIEVLVTDGAEHEGKQCARCGLITYSFFGARRWKYRNGALHEGTETPSCD